MTVPYWVPDAIFYQIFPDRFANGDLTNDPANVQPWGSPPTPWGFQGGDLRGVIQQFDYLLDLGVNALYFNPIFLSPANHRYSTTDYFQIDPRLGTLSDFRALLNLAHDNSVRVILDGVFNHCGRSFFAFADVLENQEHSAYAGWYHLRSFPVEAYSPGKAETYLGWWGNKSLPKFNTSNPAVRRYLFNVARYWIEQGIDGWRLDVPNEIDDDSFWAEFRHIVKMANPDAYLVGEIWTADPRWVGPAHFDGLMDYPVREAVLDYFNQVSLTTTQFAERVESLLKLYPHENAYAMYLCLGTHDTERLLTMFAGQVEKVKLAYTFLMSYPGAPAIYYGDEIGLQGGKDPECRGAFPWNEKEWQVGLRDWLRQLIAIRKHTPALRRGDFRRLLADERKQCYVYARSLGVENVLVALNVGPTPRVLHLPVNALGWENGRIVRNLLGAGEYFVSEGELSIDLEPWSGAWIG